MSNSASEEHDHGDGVEELGELREPPYQNPSAPPHEVLSSHSIDFILFYFFLLVYICANCSISVYFRHLPDLFISNLYALRSCALSVRQFAAQNIYILPFVIIVLIIVGSIGLLGIEK